MKKRPLMNALGASVIEVILAIGVMALAAPVAFQFVLREINETRHMGIARHLGYIRQSLLNYASVEQRNWSGRQYGGLEGHDVALRMIEEYGLNPAVPPSITDGMTVRFIHAPDGNFEVFGIVRLERLGLGFDGFMQTLRLIGDEAGHVDDGRVYSITGAWERDAAGLGQVELGPQTAIIRITDADLGAEYSSAEFLYRNALGGDDGSRMFVPLSMNGNAIRGFRVAFADRIHGAHEVVFNNAIFGGNVRIAGNLLLRGSLSFVGNSRISTPLLSLRGRSFLMEINAPAATITAAPRSPGAEINIMGEAAMPSLTAETLVFQGLDPRGSYRIRGENLLMVLRTIAGGDLFTSAIVLENGMLAGGDRSRHGYFAADYGLISLALGAHATIYNVRTSQDPSPATSAFPLDRGIELNSMVNRMQAMNWTLQQRLSELEHRLVTERNRP